MDQKQASENIPTQTGFPDAQDILMVAPIGVFRSTPEGKFLYVNKALADMYGYPAPEDLVDSVQNIAAELFADPMDGPAVASLLEADGIVKNYECEHIRKDGSRFWASGSIRTVYAEDGNVSHYQGFVTDITNRRKAEENLRESEERFRTLIEAMAEGIVLKDASDRYVHWNQTASEIFGIGIDELKGQTSESFKRQIISEDGSAFHKDDLPSLHTLRTGEPCKDVVMGIRRSHQETIWVKTNTRPYIKTGDDKPGGVIISFADITEQKRIETELLINKLAIDSSINALAMADLDGNLTYVNQAFLDLWGYESPDEVYGRQATLFWKAEKDPARVIDSLRNQGAWKGEMTARRQDGSLFDAQLSANMVLDGKGKPLCMQASFVDITEQKQSEERIRHLNAVLQAYTLVNRIIVHARDMKLLLHEICQALISTRGYHNAWIILLDTDRNVIDWGQAGLDDEFPELLARFQAGRMTQRALNVLSSHLLQVVIDPRDECRDCPLAESYAGKSSLSVRLEVEGFVLGLLTVSIPRNLAGDSEEHELFTNLAGSIAQGLQRLRLENIRRSQRQRLMYFERIISRINDPMSLVSKDYRYIVVNDAYLLTHDKPREEIEGRTVEELVGKDVFHSKIKHYLDTALEGQEVVYEDSFPDRDGLPRNRIMNYYPFLDQDGQVSGIVVTARDITKQKQAELALTKRHKIMAQAEELAGLGSWEWDINNDTWHFSDNWVNIHGCANSQLSTSQLIPIAYPEDKSAIESAFAKAVEEGRPYDIEHRIVRQDTGGVRYVHARGMVELDAAGKPKVMVGAVQDITDRKQAEERIRIINEELQIANAEKDKLFSIIAHDLKSPMSGLVVSTQMLTEQPSIFSEKDFGFLAMELHNTAKNSFELLEDLLQWARMKQGGIDYAPMPSSLTDLLNMGLPTVQDMAKNKEIVLRQDIEPLLTVLVDQPMIKTVIRNILFNAIKFTPRQGEIVVTARQAERKVIISIQDNGMGMNKQLLSSIFTLAKDKCQLGTDGEKGTGLGLVLCKQFIEQHGERIWVESSPGLGTTVYFTLPTA
jgi:PAS domain S-box-containing protein